MQSNSLLGLLEQGARRDASVHCLSVGTQPVWASKSRADIWTDAAVVGAALRRRLGPGGTVAALLSTSHACLSAMFGTWRAGLQLASMPHPGRAMPAEAYRAQLERMCALVSAEILLVDAEYLPLTQGLDVETVAFEALDSLAPGPALKHDDEPGGFVQFTSGSTSDPKGVQLTPAAMATNIRAIVSITEAAPQEVACSWLPWSHDMGLIGMCLSTWVSMGDLAFIAPEQFLANPGRWLRACSDFRANVTTAPNFAFGLAQRWLARSSGLDLSPLRVVITGAETVRAETLRAFEAAAGPFGFDGTALCPAYGLAEATLAVTMVPPQEHWHAVSVDSFALADGRWEPGEGPATTDVVSTGVVLNDLEIRIAAAEGDDIGEIEVRGGSMYSGYVGRAPRRPEDWHATRDLGCMREGGLYIGGRTTDLILVGGRNLYARDIERVAERHAAVRPGSCVAVDDGKGRFAVVAERARNVDGSLDEAARVIRATLAGMFSASPSAVVFVAPGTVPKTPSGKLQRHLVRHALEAGELAVEAQTDFRGGGVPAAASV